MKFRIFWDVAPCSQVDVVRRFRGAYCLHHRPYDESSMRSKTSVNINLTTGRYISEDSELHARRRENLIFHITAGIFYKHFLYLHSI
jgi:hypothetical protein